jgi:hypothetical protein
MEVLNRQQVFTPGLNPLFLPEGLALGTMAVPAGVIGYIHMAAAVRIPVPAKSSTSAYLNGVHGAQMIKGHPVGTSIVFTILTEDIGHLDALTGRLHRGYRERLQFFGYTVQGTADLCKVQPADMQIDGRGRG